MTDNNKKTHLIVTGRGGGGTQVQADWSQTDSEQPDYIKNKPELATVATTGDYDDLTNKPTIPEAPVQSDWSQTDSTALDYIKNKPSIPSGQVQADWNQTDNAQVDYIKNKPTIPAAQVNSDWNSNSGVSQILNKPTLATVATSGNYSDLNGTPTLATVATSGDYDDLTNKPTIPVVPTNVSAFTNDAGYTTFDGDYNSLTNKPTIPAAQVNSDWNASTGVSQILNKPTLATVATTGDYDDLTNKPTIPAAQVNSDWNSNSGVSQILNKPSLATVATSGNYSDLNGTPSLATVATSGDYDDLQNKPTIPAAPVQSDWNEVDSSSLAYIANKPTIPAAQVNSDWNAVSGVAQILNKPTIPTVPPMATETLTFTLQGGTIKTIEFYTVPNYFYVEDISGSDSTLSITKNDANQPTVEVFKSTDKTNWELMGTTDTTAITATIPANGKLYLKATTNNWGFNKISANKNHNIGGNIMSLLYGDNFEGQTTFPTNSTTFTMAFMQDNKLINAESLVLPVTTLNPYCYQQMFGYCSSLTTAPALPATTLAQNCYSYMFSSCTSLIEAPTLPATTLANYCYNAMFSGCTALTTIPETLPATTLTNGCYKQMFQNCSTLTTAPVLPATTLVSSCYYDMFEGCRSLNKITTYATSVNSGSHLGWWCSNVAATGDFYNLGGATYPSGGYGIPTGWTEHTSL